MTQTQDSQQATEQEFTLEHKVRFVTATSLFDGHDASIHIMRRILQSEGAEVIHLGHNRSVEDIVNTAIHEDAQGIAVSSYQGGHVEYFTYMVELLKEKGAGHIKVFGGGGGVIVPEEIALLHERGVARIFSPEDGQELGLEGMIRQMLKTCDVIPHGALLQNIDALNTDNPIGIARAITTIEMSEDEQQPEAYQNIIEAVDAQLKGMTPGPLLGFTGTGGAGKSSLVDEVLLRFLDRYPDKTVAVLSVDPSRRRTGGALLGDRIRMNSSSNPRVFIRSMATRRANLATSQHVQDALKVLQAAGFDLVILETAGIGQSDSEVADLSDIPVYVMTPEFGAPTQLEKIDMLDYADLIVINKFDRNGALDALRDVKKTYQRNHKRFEDDVATMPVYGTCAHRFNDLGTNTFFNALMNAVAAKTGDADSWAFETFAEGDANTATLIPEEHSRYLGEISKTVRGYREQLHKEMETVEQADGCLRALQALGDAVPEAAALYSDDALANKDTDVAVLTLRQRYNELLRELSPDSLDILQHYDEVLTAYLADENVYQVRGKEIRVENYGESLSHLKIPKVKMPTAKDWSERLKFTKLENVPGKFPYTAGVFEYKRTGEDPTRMFAGEGTAEQTNRRFHYVSKGQAAARLSTAFDSVTLYGANPAERMDIYGKIGNAGVSICTLDDAKRLYSGFDLCAPSTSVSMTINGPAPTILAFFMNSAIDAAIERKHKADGTWPAIEQRIEDWFTAKGVERPTYREELPEGHDGMGLGFLGVCADQIVDPAEYAEVKAQVLSSIRGTVQADILKEDQAQNTCIFSTEFALRAMADVQAYFIDHNVRNFYSVSISGYHIAEAGATPISQLAFTLANGFTLLEYYRARGMDVNKFAPNLSFFFSNGLDPEYSVIGRVARRIWAIALRDLYGADERSQKLKYHIQTSGRSLHAQEVDFNDIRTTLQALYAIADNCNSLHTNAYDEAITTPTEESVRRAIAIQLIINNECGLAKNENPLQGSYFQEYLTDLVEEAVLKEFESIDRRGGVLGAMETMYQRSRIQEDSMAYETLKHNGDFKIIGVNTYINPNGPEEKELELRRSSDESKDMQIKQVADLKICFADESTAALSRLKEVARDNGNLFEELMEAAKVCSLGEITDALFEVGGAYRRNM